MCQNYGNQAKRMVARPFNVLEKPHVQPPSPSRIHMVLIVDSKGYNQPNNQLTNQQTEQPTNQKLTKRLKKQD